MVAVVLFDGWDGGLRLRRFLGVLGGWWFKLSDRFLGLCSIVPGWRFCLGV